MRQHYETLQIPVSSSKDEIKKAFRRLAHIYHPDKGGDAKKFSEINNAYTELMKEPERVKNPFNNDDFNNFWKKGGSSMDDVEEMMNHLRRKKEEQAAQQRAHYQSAYGYSRYQQQEPPKATRISEILEKQQAEIQQLHRVFEQQREQMRLRHAKEINDFYK